MIGVIRVFGARERIVLLLDARLSWKLGQRGIGHFGLFPDAIAASFWD